MPPKKNLSCLRQITRRVKIVIRAAPRLRRQARPEPVEGRKWFALIQEYQTYAHKIFWTGNSQKTGKT